MQTRIATVLLDRFPWWMPPNGAQHGHAIDRQMIWNLAIVSALFLIALALLLFAILRRKPSPGSKSIRWTIPATLLMCVLFAVMSLTAQHLWSINRGEALQPDLSALQIEVVGVQFQWYFRYPGTDRAFGETRPELIAPGEGNPLGLDPADRHAKDDFVSSILVLPIGRPVDIQLRALDVIHGFFIPGMRLKQNAVPGLVQHIHFTPDQIGDYPIVCTQLCGLGHYRMQAQLRVLSQHDFDLWLSSKESAATKRSGDN